MRGSTGRDALDVRTGGEERNRFAKVPADSADGASTGILNLPFSAVSRSDSAGGSGGGTAPFAPVSGGILVPGRGTVTTPYRNLRLSLKNCKRTESIMKSAVHHLSGRRKRQLRNHTLLAPLTWHQEHRFRDLVVDPSAHEEMIGAVQRFRGRSYLEDGALHASQLTTDGRYCQPMDKNSWQLIAQDDMGEVISCARYYPIPEPRFEATIVSKSALANSPEWRAKVMGVVENSISRASKRGATFAELGGWCVANSVRNSAQALHTVLLMFALGEILGGTVGLSTATKRHSSSSILQRLGARRAGLNGEVLPAYFEPQFDCEMELLQFDSLHPAERYASQVSEYCSMMKTDMRVICCQLAPPTCIPSLAALLRALSPAAQFQNQPLSQGS